MPLTEQRKKELFEVLDRTSLRPKNAPAPEYPQEYKDFFEAERGGDFNPQGGWLQL